MTKNTCICACNCLNVHINLNTYIHCTPNEYTNIPRMMSIKIYKIQNYKKEDNKKNHKKGPPKD